MRALLTEDTAWAPGGHEVAWTQFPAALPEPAARPVAYPGRPHTPRRAEGGLIVLGPGTFDAASGTLRYIDGAVVRGPALDVWRAPTDNDRGMADRHPDRQLDRLWRESGLHRMRHRVDRVTVGGDTLTVETRVAPAASGLGLRTVYAWSAAGDRLRLDVRVTPEGDWRLPLPRLGVRMGLCPTLEQAEWFGGGPGEAYPDTRAASRIGHYRSTVDALQTPYVRPQENGARADVRRLELRRENGTGLRVEGSPAFWMTVRPWTTESLDAAAHTCDLKRDGMLWVHLDHALHGVGSASCGPEVLPAYRLSAAPAAFSFTFSPLPAREDDEEEAQ